MMIKLKGPRLKRKYETLLTILYYKNVSSVAVKPFFKSLNSTSVTSYFQKEDTDNPLGVQEFFPHHCTYVHFPKMVNKSSV